MDTKKKRTADAILARFRLHERLWRFRDLRTKPKIPLPTILLSVLLMPLWSAGSLLALDRLARSRSIKRLFSCTHRALVLSDSTVRRALHWLSPRQLQRFALETIAELDRKRMFLTRFPEGARPRRVAVIDGTVMSGHPMSVVALTGSLTAAPLMRHIPREGYERRESRALITALPSLGRMQPELLLLDPLYFDVSTITMIRSRGMHALIKGAHMPHRTIISDAANDFAADAAEWHASGYDTQRLCRWWIEATAKLFATIPVVVARISERDSKTAALRSWWVVTTDHSLCGGELREASYCRWRIENRYFKELSERAGTKRYAVKDPRSFTSMLMLLSIGMALVKWFTTILARFDALRKEIIGTEKATLGCWMLRLRELLPPGWLAFAAPAHE